MKVTSLSSSDLKRVAALLQSKAQLLGQIARVETQLEAYDSGRPLAHGRSGTTPKAGVRTRQPRGAVKQAIIDLIKRNGSKGATVKEISGVLGVDPNRIYTWFYSTGSRVKQIKKIGEATYRWSA